MAKAKEFRVTVEDKPGALAACCLALAEHGVNILAFQSFVEQGESLARFVVDDPAAALAVLRGLRANFEEDDVAIVSMEHRPGELGRAASLLGKNRININYSYSGLEPAPPCRWWSSGLIRSPRRRSCSTSLRPNLSKRDGHLSAAFSLKLATRSGALASAVLSSRATIVESVTFRFPTIVQSFLGIRPCLM